MLFKASENERLDKFLSKELRVSRNQIEKLIKKGLVKVEKKVVKKGGVVLKPSQLVEVELPQPSTSKPQKVDFDIEVLYEDEDILVLNKPAGVVVHPAPSVKEATLVDWLKEKKITLSTISGEERQGIVHRLDKETSGAMVVAKNNLAHQALAAQLQTREMGRYYLALITPPLKENLIVDQPIARNPKNRLKMAVVNGGRESKSAFTKIALSKDGKKELIGAKLFSGRTHQIRVHLNFLQRSILGDSLYGFKSRVDKILRVFLHSYILYLIHPKSGELMKFVAPLPKDIHSYLKQHFDMERVDEKIDPSSFDRLFDFIKRV